MKISDVIGLVILAILFFGGIGFVIYELRSQVDFWYTNYKSEKDTYQYYFDGANKRGLLDICHNGDGDLKVLFKEDCKS